MDKNYIYIEPSIIGYKLDSPLSNISREDLDNFLDFAKQLKDTIDIAKLIGYKVILSNSILENIVAKHPSIPFKFDNIEDREIKAIAISLHRIFKSFIYNSMYIKIADINSKCGVSSDFDVLIDKVGDYFLDFFELILNGCEINGQVLSDTVIKDRNNSIFSSNTYTVYCDKSCSKEFKNKLNCLTIDEIKEVNIEYLTKVDLLESISYTELDVKAYQNDHHSVFNAKINCFNDIPNPEKLLFTSLNKIVKIKELIFREHQGISMHGEAVLYNIEHLDCNDEKYARIKCTLSLKRRGSNPPACVVEMYIDRITLDKLNRYMDATEIPYISLDFLKSILKEM